jgi:hypothetical protein
MRTFWRAVVEVGFIIFLFYSNLLMGEFERTGAARAKGLEWGLLDIFTWQNFGIAILAAAVGYVLVELLRTRLWPAENTRNTGLFKKTEVENSR